MTQIHTSYEVSARIKEFLGESAPEPLSEQWYTSLGTIVNNGLRLKPPAYQLHDLLSKLFTEAMFKKVGVVEMTDTDLGIEDDYDVFLKISYAYYEGGLPVVERVLMEMMEDR